MASEDAARAGTRNFKVLLAGGEDGAREAISAVLRDFGHDLIHTGCGTDLLPLFTQHRPDLVILDLRVAGAGYTAVEALRLAEKAGWLTIWCIASNTPGDEQELAAALDSGADACLERPIRAAILKARLRRACRHTARQRQSDYLQQELQTYYETSEHENKVARVIMDRLLRTQTDYDGVLKSWIAPAFKFSGDVVAAERSPDGSLKILLADGVGHGLSAALNVLPVGRAFQSMAQKGFGLAALVTELNQLIRRDLPSNRFVAATLVNVDAAQKLVEVWNGGNPPCIMVDHAGNIADIWESSHLPLGVVDTDELDPRPECSVLRADCQMLLYSDGAVEALNAEGNAFGDVALVETLEEAVPDMRLDAVKFAIVEHLAGQPANDDVTLALLDCGEEMRMRATHRPTVIEPAMQTAPAAVWEVSLMLEAGRLQGMDVLPILQEFLGRIDQQWTRDAAAFAVLSDLYASALEQGLLQLDTHIKAQSDGLNAYAQARADALRDLPPGNVRITVSRAIDHAGNQLRISVHQLDADAAHHHDLAPAAALCAPLGAATAAAVPAIQ